MPGALRHPSVTPNLLHLAFCEWEYLGGGVPCTRETFVALLRELGFLIGEIEGTLLVSGLILKVDMAALERHELVDDVEAGGGYTAPT